MGYTNKEIEYKGGYDQLGNYTTSAYGPAIHIDGLVQPNASSTFTASVSDLMADTKKKKEFSNKAQAIKWVYNQISKILKN